MDNPQITANIPDLGAPKAFTPGALVVESQLVELDPQPLGTPYRPPMIPINPATEGLVRQREIRRQADSRVEILTLRYENPAEQESRLAWLAEQIAAQAEADAAPCGECGEIRANELHLANADGPWHEWEPEIVQADDDPRDLGDVEHFDSAEADDDS